jgi:hypothetical protein
MENNLATSNVDRSYSLAATSMAIFTFILFFLYPKYASGDVGPVAFQVTLIVMGVATFSFVFASFHYYRAALGARIDAAQRDTYSLRADRTWLLGAAHLFLAPSLILYSLGLLVVASVWLVLWLAFLIVLIPSSPCAGPATTRAER